MALDPQVLIAQKRARLAELMNEHLASSYRFNGYMDIEGMGRVLERGRQHYGAEMPEIKNMPESQLDALLTYYGGGGFVY